MRDKIILITGAGSGLGEAAALRLARAGADLVLLGRTRDELEEVATRIRKLGRKALVLEADISRDADMRSALAEAGKVFGRLDGVFANAGINGVWAPLDELTVKEWDETQAINLRGTFLTLHHAIPLLREQGGAVAITASINGTRSFTSAGASAYAVSKAGQVALMQMAAVELARYRIRVNAICPGSIETEIEDNTEKRDTVRVNVRPPDMVKVPLTHGAPGSAEEVAELVLFLLSDSSRHITGTPVWIDGGQSLVV